MSDEDKHKKPWIKSWMVKSAMSAAALSQPVMWVGKATDGFSHWPHTVNVSHTPPANDKERDDATYKIKAHLAEVIAGFNTRNGHKELAITDAELAYANEKYKDFEVLAEKRSDGFWGNGFYGVLLLDKSTNTTVLVLPGADFPAKLGKMVNDYDDMMLEGSGGPVSQTRMALNFAREAERISREKTGQGVKYCSNFSLGAYHGYFIAGTNTLPEAQFFFYEGPGINSTTVRFCSRYGKISKEQVMKIYRERCYSFMPENNLVNDMNTQVGTRLTFVNDEAGSFWNPERHSMGDDRVNELASDQPMVDRQNSAPSPAIPAAFIIFGSLAVLPWAVGAARRRIGDYYRKGFSKTYQELIKEQREQGPSDNEKAAARA